MYDAVYLFAKALHDLDTTQQIDIHPINCDSAADTFSHGFSLINYMKVVSKVPFSILHVGTKYVLLLSGSIISESIQWNKVFLIFIINFFFGWKGRGGLIQWRFFWKNNFVDKLAHLSLRHHQWYTSFNWMYNLVALSFYDT